MVPRRLALIFGVRLAVASAMVMSWLLAGAVRAGELVEFSNVSEHSRPSRLRGYLARPDGEGPFPAVVVLHGCNGISGASIGLADRLSSLGYVGLTVDSLGPRGSAGECGRFFLGQEIDAYAALHYLSQQSFVDADRVAVLGNSMGGSSALFAVDRGGVEKMFYRKFQAAIAYYPYCRNHLGVMTAPTMILIGEEDDWNPAAACREMVERPRTEGARVDLHVYPGAHHGFNFRELETARRVLGHRLEYNGPAATDAWEKVLAFLAANLGRSP
jgi:dienelactone hydrolase